VNKVLVIFALSVMVAAAVLGQADKPSEKEKAEIQKIIDKIPSGSLEAYRAKFRLGPFDRAKVVPLKVDGIRTDPAREVLLSITPHEIYAEVPLEIGNSEGREPEQKMQLLHFADGKETKYWPDDRSASTQSKKREAFIAEQFDLFFFNSLSRYLLHHRFLREGLSQWLKDGRVRHLGSDDSVPSPNARLEITWAQGDKQIVWFDMKTGYPRRIETRAADGKGPEAGGLGLMIEVIEFATKGKSPFPGKVRMTSTAFEAGGQRRPYDCTVEEFEILDGAHKVDFKLPAGTRVRHLMRKAGSAGATDGIRKGEV